MNQEDYKRLLEGVSKPTAQQTENFIGFVANHHSWYKHLGSQRKSPFFFYLDPNAGGVLQDVLNVGGSKNEKRFVFKENTSNDYQRLYGNWQYNTNGYTVNYIRKPDGSFRDAGPLVGLHIVDKEGAAHIIPDDVVNQVKFLMSRFLHEFAFKNAHNYFEDDGVSYADKHASLINDLRQHLNSFLAYVYDDI